MKKNATSGIREAVTDFLTPMFDDYKDIKGIKTKAIKEHVKKSMKGSKDQLFQHIRTRQKEIENDMKVNPYPPIVLVSVKYRQFIHVFCRKGLLNVEGAYCKWSSKKCTTVTVSFGLICPNNSYRK